MAIVVQPRVGDRVHIVNYGGGEDIGNMDNPTGKTGTLVAVDRGLFLDVKLDAPIWEGENQTDEILVKASEIEVLNAGS